jgi:hypothetical protein
MIIGHRWWILIWYGILTIGVVGLLAAIYWARQSHWRNLDEILRAVGTIAVSVGMLLFLYDIAWGVAQALLLAALLSFVLAFVVGRRDTADRPPADDEGDLPE